MIGMFLAALDQTIVGTALPHHRQQPARTQPHQLGGHRLPADLHHLHAPLREALRPVRPQGPLPGRHRHLPGRLGAVRAQPEHGPADRLPGHPGPRGRRADGAGLHHHRRRGLPPGAGPLPGVLRRHLRPLLHRRPAARRGLHRQPQLAVDLLHQPPHRDRGPGRDLGRAQAPVPPPGPQDRLPRLRTHAGRGDGGAAGHRVGRHPVRLGLAGDPRPGHRRRRPHHRLRAVGTEGGRADPAAEPLPHRDLPGVDVRLVRPGHDHVRRGRSTCPSTCSWSTACRPWCRACS